MESFDIVLPGRGGSVHGLACGPSKRAVDIVFLHANGFNAHTYQTILEPLGRELRVIALDQRGHGRTSLPTDTEQRCDWFDLRDDLVAALSNLGVCQAVLSGHSMGGTVAILTAAQHPGFASSLVLFDPVVIPRSGRTFEPHTPMAAAARRRRATFESFDQAFASYRGRGAFGTWPDQILRDYLADGLRPLSAGGVTLTCTPKWEASGYASHGHDTVGAMAALTCPTLILKAEKNSTCSLDNGATAPGGLRVEIVAGTTHFLPMERPDLMREALRAAVAAKA